MLTYPIRPTNMHQCRLDKALPPSGKLFLELIDQVILFRKYVRQVFKHIKHSRTFGRW